MDALELTEYSEVFSQNSDPLGKNGDYHYLTLLQCSIHAVWVYKKHPYKKQLVEFSKNKKRRLVQFGSTKKRNIQYQ